MLTRIINVIKYIKGDGVLLTVNKDTLIVDAGKNDQQQIKQFAAKFFKEAYMLGK